MVSLRGWVIVKDACQDKAHDVDERAEMKRTSRSSFLVHTRERSENN